MNSELRERLIAFRRDLHMHPELGYREFRTTQRISEALSAEAIPHITGPANMKTGAVATIKKGDGPCIVLRADIDALPIHEQTDLPYASQTPNTMHACGHDVHATMLLGAAILLKDADFNGTIKCIFQPSEEGVYDDPDHMSGGHRMVEGGIIDDAAHCIALHVHPLQPLGQISCAIGEALACAGFFTINITGKGGHAGAAPHLSIDPILISSYIVQAAQSIVSRNISPTQPAVLSITKIEGGFNENVIPDTVQMKGTVRAMNTETYNLVKSRFYQILEGIAQAFNAKIDMFFTVDYPSVFNDKELHKKLQSPLSEVFGENIAETQPMLAAEDFAFYSRKAPSMFYFIGCKDTAPETFFVHHPRMVVNEDCIPMGAEFLSKAALHLLRN
jgi:amidohydrolase